MLTQSQIKKLLQSRPGKDTWMLDSPGLYLRSQGDAWFWYIRTRAHGKQHTVKVGPGSMDAAAARTEAMRIMLDLRQGVVQQKFTMADLMQLHEQQTQDVKPSTHANYRGLRRKILEHISSRTQINTVSPEQLRKLHIKLGGSYSANRALEVLKKSWRLAREYKWTESDPTEFVRAAREQPRQHVLTQAEITRLLDACEAWQGAARAFPHLVRLLLFTGLRKTEWSLRPWADLDDDVIHLPDSKSGERWHALPGPALEQLKALKAMRLSDTWIIPNIEGDGPLTWTKRHWNRLLRDAALDDGVRMHDLRHTAGSYAHSRLGLSQREIADMLGHRDMASSARYIGGVDSSRRSIARRLDGLFDL